METFPQVIRELRQRRGKTQQALADEAQVSTRHLSCIENGRAKPSRDLVQLLADALDLPLRERNRLLIAAGLSPEYSEHALGADEMREARAALELMLRGHAPFPAVCFDRGGDVIMANEPYLALARLFSLVPPGVRAYVPLPSPRPNIVRALLESDAARQLLRNYDEVVAAVVARARRELIRQADKARRAELELLVRASGRLSPNAVPPPPRLILPLELTVADDTIRFISTIATLGTTFDITLDELRIELYHPADAHSDSVARRWLGT